MLRADPRSHREEFLRDETQLAARMTGMISIDGKKVIFESFLFAKIEAESGKMEHLIERAVWTPGEENRSRSQLIEGQVTYTCLEKK